MSAITRWIEYSTAAVGSIGDGRGAGCRGTRGYRIGTDSVGDSFTIGATTSQLHLAMDGDSGPYLTLYSGSSLDPRFVARDITEKMHNLGKSDQRWDNAICKWENIPGYGNRLKIYSGTLGSSSSVTVTSGINDAKTVLGFDTTDHLGGSNTNNSFNGTASVSGTYYGLFDEVYKVVISNDDPHGSTNYPRGVAKVPTKGGTNNYAGTITTGGVFNHTSDIEYVIRIDITNGPAMGAGTGNVPQMQWTSTGGADDSSAWTELLYPNFWYKVGIKGAMVKFTDATFNTCNPAWTMQCYKPDYAEGTNGHMPVGIAQYVWSSDRGDMSSSPITTISGAHTRLGSRGLEIKFIGTNDLYARDEFYVIVAAPKPSGYNITSLNYGNVTVSTESDVKAVMFEIESGAIEMSTVKFGLQSHGSFSHHNTGNSDTYFRFGTVGPDKTAGGSPINGIEWYPNIVAADIDSDVAPLYLYATEDNLPAVATADLSESVGNYPMCGLNSDPIWVNIRLGASETGANSSINYRCFFDYS
jgi:hypothetical protein